ncbi:hypothetical protein ACHAXT_006093 [Thalassiosira profunda]
MCLLSACIFLALTIAVSGLQPMPPRDDSGTNAWRRRLVQSSRKRGKRRSDRKLEWHAPAEARSAWGKSDKPYSSKGSKSDDPSWASSSAKSGKSGGHSDVHGKWPPHRPAISRSPSEHPTGAPSASPSGNPSAMPSTSPTAMPTATPSDGPSDMPSVAGSGRPSVAPTAPPSASGSQFPSPTPSTAPSESMSGAPSDGPSVAPSSSSVPTRRIAPSAVPTYTGSPSGRPSSTPSEEAETQAPSSSPSISVWPTDGPSAAPSTSAPTLAPTTDAPTLTLFVDERPALFMELYGLTTTMSPAQRQRWARQTERFIEDFYNNNNGTGILDEIKESVYGVEARIRVVGENIATARPTASPTTPLPTEVPTRSLAPSDRAPSPPPTAAPTTASPTGRPTISPTDSPTVSAAPTPAPSPRPSEWPSSAPTAIAWEIPIEAVNLARSGTAVQSSTCFDAVAARAIDGRTSPYFGAQTMAHTCAEPNPWWEVDLGEVQEIGHVVVHNRMDACCSNKLDNAQVWVTDGAGTIVASQELENGIRMNHVAGRFIRVQKNADGVLALPEVEVYGDVFEPIVTTAADGARASGRSGLQAYGVRMRTKELDVDDESYLPETGVDDESYLPEAGMDRRLRTKTRVTEPCRGSDPLTVKFSLELSYRTNDELRGSNLVVAFPFTAVEFRERYIDYYLKGGGAGDEPTNSPESPAPTLQPTESLAPTLVPTQSFAPSEAPTTANPTLLPTTVAPTETSAPSASSAPSLAPTRIRFRNSIQGLEMDLFGLDFLNRPNRQWYIDQTAAYINDFYNENYAPQAALLEGVSSAIGIQDQTVPMTQTTGTDCDEIDPLILTFALSMGYYTSADDLNFDSIVQYPFSTDEFRQRYIDDYLKADSPRASVWQENLQCVSEVRVPGQDGDSGGLVPSSPADAGVPSAAPTAFVDDIFSVRLVDPTAYERKCEHSFRGVSPEKLKEFELTFVYGVESMTENVDDLVEDMESLILDLVGTSVLRCSIESSATSVQLRRSDGVGDGGVAGVIRVRYPEFGDITSTAQCEPMAPKAKGCAVLTSKLLVTSTGEPIVEVHQNVLLVLAEAFQQNIFLEVVPELIASDFLGPSLDSVTLSLTSQGAETGSGSSTTVAVLFSVVCVALILQAVACFAFPARRQAFGKVIGYYQDKWRAQTGRDDHSESLTLRNGNLQVNRRIEE